MKNRIVCCTAALLLAAGGLGTLPAGTLNTAIVVSAYDKGYFTYDDKDVQTKDGFTYIILGDKYSNQWDYYYEYEDLSKEMEGAAEILDYEIKGDTLEFPDEIDGHPVKIIECNTLRKSNVKKVILPQTLRYFFDSEYKEYEGDGFYFYGALLNIPETILSADSVEYVEFRDNKSATEFTAEDGVLFHDSDKYGKELCCVPPSRTDYTIPADIISIGEKAFSNNRSTSFTIPENITHIGDDAFTECPNLKSVDIKANIKETGNDVFFQDKKLETVILPDTLETIGPFFLAGCSSLNNITIPSGVKTLDSFCFAWCSSLTSIDIPDSVTLIRDAAFEECTALSEVKMSNNIETIEWGAFITCDKLNSLSLPKSIKKIDKGAIGVKYHDPDTGKYVINEDFVLYCHPGTGANYAVRNGLKYELLSPAYSMKNAKITLTGGSRYVYTGKAVKPEFTVTLNGKTFKKGLHYTVSYKANKAPGKAKVIVDGIGSYAGHLGKTFYISPRQMTAKKLTTPKKGAVKLYWNQDKTADGYQIIVKSKGFAKDSKNVTIKKNSTVAKTVTGLKSGRKYAVKIRAYKTVDGRKLYGKCSKKLSIKCR